MTVSNATHVTLRNVGFNLSGNFTCEVTADAPSFYTGVATNVLTVVELPHSAPTLWTEHTKYDPGDILRANCSTPPSKPGATITFLLNSMTCRHSVYKRFRCNDLIKKQARNEEAFSHFGVLKTKHH
ncbi:uncharacterized protein LOC129717234 [Wyeomyia smithii]|uniref:uncharacterized protein LOC129717234 n=1 Tax=Wyeomyia smithii TaxID=174621 RepID=UPI002467B611|nr:uncharacterized protein LOC129717234 [Wyeomyia smithii]